VKSAIAAVTSPDMTVSPYLAAQTY
jgi:hypothetical protein